MRIPHISANFLRKKCRKHRWHSARNLSSRSLCSTLCLNKPLLIFDVFKINDDSNIKGEQECSPSKLIFSN
nr:MAG TPA: hypothetical protein [Inoviridae sp.]